MTFLALGQLSVCYDSQDWSSNCHRCCYDNIDVIMCSRLYTWLACMFLAQDHMYLVLTV